MTQSSVQSGAKTKTVTGPVEAANRGGVKIAGAWHNYGRTFKGERPDKDAVGRRVELTLVYSTRDGKWFIRSVSTPVETKAHAPAKGGASKPSNKGRVATKVKASATSGSANTKSGKGRSGGAVDAPGKKHRKPMPSEAAATGSPRGAGARIAKLKMANEARRTRQRG